MKNMTTHLMVGRGVVVCLLLLVLTNLKVAAQEICPIYPRAMDQVFVCYELSKLKIAQNSCLHNPVKFTFPALPSNITVTFDAGDGNGPVNVSSDGVILTVTYPSPGQFPLNWTMNTTYGNFSGTILFQSNFNNLDANYSDFLPDETWGDMIGNTYTPPVSGAYPPGSPNTLPVSAGGIVHILYANPDHRMRKPFIFVEGFDPILEGLDQYVAPTYKPMVSSLLM